MFLDCQQPDVLLPHQPDNFRRVRLAEFRIDVHGRQFHRGCSGVRNAPAVVQREQPKELHRRQGASQPEQPPAPAKKGEHQRGGCRDHQPRSEGQQLDHGRRPFRREGAERGQDRHRQRRQDGEHRPGGGPAALWPDRGCGRTGAGRVIRPSLCIPHAWVCPESPRRHSNLR